MLSRSMPVLPLWTRPSQALIGVCRHNDPSLVIVEYKTAKKIRMLCKNSAWQPSTCRGKWSNTSCRADANDTWKTQQRRMKWKWRSLPEFTGRQCKAHNPSRTSVVKCTWVQAFQDWVLRRSIPVSRLLALEERLLSSSTSVADLQSDLSFLIST